MINFSSRAETGGQLAFGDGIQHPFMVYVIVDGAKTPIFCMSIDGPNGSYVKVRIPTWSHRQATSFFHTLKDDFKILL